VTRRLRAWTRKGVAGSPTCASYSVHGDMPIGTEGLLDERPEDPAPQLFKGFDLPDAPEQIALLVFGGRGQRTTLGGGRLQFAGEFLEEVFRGLRGLRLASNAVHE